MNDAPASNGWSGDGRRGPLAWMARNHVAANLLMLVFLLGGLIMAPTIKQEVFPEVDFDFVAVSVPYPGASPEEVEQGVILAVEEAVRGIDGVEEIRSTAGEGQARVVAELLRSAEPSRVLDDVKSAVDRITSFPEDAEQPVIRLGSNRREVLSLMIYGNLTRHQLRWLSEQARDELLQDARIILVEIEGIPPPEISIEVPQANLRRYGLTLPQIAEAVNQASIELPGGAVETPGGEVLLRTVERRYFAEGFEDIIVLSRPDGTEVRLKDIGRVIDGFRDIDREAYFNGQPAVRLRVFRIGEQTPLEVSAAVREYVQEQRAAMPESVGYAVWNDSSEIYHDRVRLLLKNGAIGLVLVLAILGLFLRLWLAFWVTLGMLISFLGAFLFMAAVDVSINMISLFAFLLALGIVVDDAIVVGEAVYNRRTEGKHPLAAAVAGVREVNVPVVFAVLTTVIAFLPMLFVPGVIGKFIKNIPMIVIPILGLSLFESLFILPAHLGHDRGEAPRRGILGRLQSIQEGFAGRLEHFVEHRYAPFAEALLAHRYLTLSASLALLLVTFGWVAGGRILFDFLPKIEGEIVTVSVEMPAGTALEDTRAVMNRLVAAGEAVVRESGGEAPLLRGIYAEVGRFGAAQEDPGRDSVRETGSHLAQVAMFLTPAGERPVAAAELTRRWRRRVGEIAGVERMAFTFSIGPPAGATVAIELAHPDENTLHAAATRLAEALSTYEGVFDVDDGFTRGKAQLDLQLKPAARSLGVTELDLARQVRGAFFGAESERQQRGRHELRIFSRLPEEERDSEYHIERLVIRTPEGGEIPLRAAAYVTRGRSFTEIVREQGRRVVEVTADVDENVTSGSEVVRNLEAEVLPGLLDTFSGLRYELSGQQQERREALGALRVGIAIAFLVMFSLMAIAFGSYIQPVIVMLAIPFGLVGAIAGHLVMGFNLSVISLFGMVALSGVVVNDSLVLISAINDYRRDGLDAMQATTAGAVRRFRPILLTSLTTFFGLAPMIFETSLQARFLIPMAISLGFGVLFVTVIALIIVPAAYMVVEDVRRRVERVAESSGERHAAHT